MTYWQETWLILGMTVVTLGVRYPLLAVSGRIKMSKFVREALNYVPVAVLSAIAVPMMLAPGGELNFSIQNEYLLAGIVSVAVAAVSRHLLLTIIVGMSLFLLLRFFV